MSRFPSKGLPLRSFETASSGFMATGGWGATSLPTLFGTGLGTAGGGFARFFFRLGDI
jgi:hypothetical protein